jgi:glucose-6-phosphate-specific signal transduction histidine kinase
MEGVHGRPVRAGDGDVGRPAQRAVDVDEEVRLAVAAEAHGAVALQQHLVAERVERPLVERLAAVQVADSQADVVDHRLLPSSRRLGGCGLREGAVA